MVHRPRRRGWGLQRITKVEWHQARLSVAEDAGGADGCTRRRLHGCRMLDADLVLNWSKTIKESDVCLLRRLQQRDFEESQLYVPLKTEADR